MARTGTAKPRARRPEPRPAPLPPERRTVGQLVAETIAFYGRNFFQTIPLGLSFATVTQLTAEFGRRHTEPQGHPPYRGFHNPTPLVGGGALTVIVLGALLLSASYVVGVVMVTGAKPDRRSLTLAYAAAALVYVPVPLLAQLLVLPAVVYLGLVGWVVPAILVERRDLRDAFRRSFRLARTDLAHAIGGLATLVILFIVVRLMLLFLLHTGAEASERAAVGLGDLVLSPMLFVGSAIVYVDLAAREKARQ